MRSHLTRRVFRRIILNQPVVKHRPLHLEARPRSTTQHARSRHNAVQTRTFFGLFQQKQGRDLREPLLDPGMEKMLELDKRLHLVARLPPAPELVRAFRAFVQSKLKRTAAIEDFHATQLLQTLRMIEHPESVQQGNAQASTGTDVKLSKADLETLFDALRTTPNQFYTKEHNTLAKTAWEAWCAREANEDPDAQGSSTVRRPSGYLKVLSGTGEAALAMQEAMKTQTFDGDADISKYCRHIIEGFAKENDIQGMLGVLESIRGRGFEPQSTVFRPVAFFYARKDDVGNTKKWFTSDLLLPGEHGRPGEAYRALLQFCLRTGEMAWGQELIESLPADADTEIRMWNAVFLSSAATGKGVDAVDRMISIMIRRSGGDKGRAFDPNIINGLIRYATSKKDAYMAERYFGLLGKYAVEPDAQTFIAQIEYRLLAGDVDGAMASYDSLRKQTIKENEDWDVMNKLLRTLIARASSPNETIMGLVDDIADRRKVIPAETVLDLCTYHLERDEYFYIVDLLQTYAFQYSIAQRLLIRDVLVEYSLKSETDTGRAWDTYMIYHQVFDQETRRDIRNRAMSSFFERGRPDLGTHVFTRMSQHMRMDSRPDADTYTSAFVGISRTNEPEALEIIHNLLKLDTETEPDTRLLNALMLAYTYCGQGGRALDFWQQIATSAEGPSYDSLHIAFRACEHAAFGYDEAIKIWNRLRQADVEITPKLLADYLACLSGQGKWDPCFQELKKFQDYTGQAADFYTIASVFNVCPGVLLQRRIKTELQEAFPKVWAQIEKCEIKETRLGTELIQGLDRTLNA